jgi:hypothetical protein
MFESDEEIVDDQLTFWDLMDEEQKCEFLLSWEDYVGQYEDE